MAGADAGRVYARPLDAVKRSLDPQVKAARGVEARAGTFFTQASIYREFTPEGVAACAWDTVAYDRDLGDLPVWLVVPKDDHDADMAALPEAQAGGDAQARRRFHIFAATRERHLATSTQSRRVVAPAGSGHNLIHEAPEFTIAVMREAICAEVSGSRQ
jgi:hypothetical protein